MRDTFREWVERCRTGEAEQVADPAVEAVHFLDNRVEMLTGGGSLRVTPDQLGCRSETGQRVPEAVGDGRGHLPDRCQLLRLNKSGPRLTQVVRHSPERQRQLADLISGARLDGVIQLSGSDHSHGAG